jgi:hypothetical protein
MTCNQTKGYSDNWIISETLSIARFKKYGFMGQDHDLAPTVILKNRLKPAAIKKAVGMLLEIKAHETNLLYSSYDFAVKPAGCLWRW